MELSHFTLGINGFDRLEEALLNASSVLFKMKWLHSSLSIGFLEAVFKMVGTILMNCKIAMLIIRKGKFPARFYRLPTRVFNTPQKSNNATFHSFPLLPLELRQEIWALTLPEPRKISLSQRKYGAISVSSGAWVGGIVHWEAECRRLGPLKSTDIFESNGKPKDPRTRGLRSTAGPVTLWINSESRNLTLKLYFPLFMKCMDLTVSPVYFSPTRDTLDFIVQGPRENHTRYSMWPAMSDNCVEALRGTLIQGGQQVCVQSIIIAPVLYFAEWYHPMGVFLAGFIGLKEWVNCQSRFLVQAGFSCSHVIPWKTYA